MSLIKKLPLLVLSLIVLTYTLVFLNSPRADAQEKPGKLGGTFNWIRGRSTPVMPNGTAAIACVTGVSSTEVKIPRIKLVQFTNPTTPTPIKECVIIRCMDGQTVTHKNPAVPAISTVQNYNDSCINAGHPNADFDYSIYVSTSGEKGIIKGNIEFPQQVGKYHEFTPTTTQNGFTLITIENNDHPQNCTLGLKISVSFDKPSEGLMSATRDLPGLRDFDKANGWPKKCADDFVKKYNNKLISIGNLSAAPPSTSSTDPSKKNGDPIDLSNLNGDNTEGSTTEDACDAQLTSPLSWILCPVIDILQLTVNRFFTAANDTLNFQIADNTTTSPVKNVWVSIRNLANILFVISFLIIIISQALVGKL